MNEYEVATEKVLPYLRDKLNWPESLISKYGRVPVQIGSSTVWADYVCYINKDQNLTPWLLIEVKQPGPPIEQAIPQAESYSLILNAPFFCITDGDQYDFYKTGASQGKSINLQSLPSIPSPEYLVKEVEHTIFPLEIDDLIDRFIEGLEKEPKFLDDTKAHDDAPKGLYEKVFQRIDSISPQDVKDAFDQYLMMKPPNRNLLFGQIDRDFDKIREILRFVRDFDGDPVMRIKQLLDKKGRFHPDGGGIFFITQLLAGAHPDEYMVLEENISKALQHFKMTDVLVKNNTANGYVYVNEICKTFYQDKLESRVKAYGFGLAAVHNFFWHYYVYYRKKGKWFP